MTETTCSICIESIDMDSVITNCGHTFHKVCLEKWKEECKKGGPVTSCPVCRDTIAKTIYITMDIVKWKCKRAVDNNIRQIQRLLPYGVCFGIGFGIGFLTRR